MFIRCKPESKNYENKENADTRVFDGHEHGRCFEYYGSASHSPVTTIPDRTGASADSTSSATTSYRATSSNYCASPGYCAAASCYRAATSGYFATTPITDT